MGNETPTITADKRDRIGTRYARRLRQAGRLPAVIYGHKKDPVHVSVDAKETMTHLHHGIHLMNVTIDGAAETCLVKDLQFGHLGDNVVHIDFARVDLTEEVSVNVALHFTGQPEAARKPGAVLTTNLAELEIVCQAGNIPHEINVDISAVETTFTVGQITLPEGVRTSLDPETPVVSITFVAEEAEGEEVEVASTDEPEVITEAAADKGETKEGTE